MGEINQPHFGKRLGDSVIEFYKPESIRVQLEVVFIHGLWHINCGDAYWKTWLARDGTPDNVWPRTWLVDEFPSAQVFALSYDASIQQTATDGRMDMYVLGEKLVQEMVDFGGIGQSGVPVVFVCHGFGGLVAKQIVLSGKRHFSQNDKVQNLLQSIDSFCFYSTPHHGSHVAKSSVYLKQATGGAKGLLLENLEVLNPQTSRINREFEQVRHPLWIFRVVAETHEIPEYGQMVVSEASSRYEIATYMALDANYLDVCKPKSKEDSSYQWLTMGMREALARNVVRLPLEVENLAFESLVRMEEQEKHVKGMLQEFRIVGLIGMGGSGKTTLAKVVFKDMCNDFERSIYLDDVKSKSALDEVLIMLLQQFGIKNRKSGGIVEQSELVDSMQCYLDKLKALVKKQKVLVIIDDVGTTANFSRLLEYMDFLNGNRDSKMIVTCREWHLLKKHAPMVGKYEMVLLNVSGMDVELFSFHAFNGARTMQQRRRVLQNYLSKDASETSMGGFESVCFDIVKACGGLPLSLEVMGSYLRGFLKDGDISPKKCLDYWKAALQKLKNAEALEGDAVNERLWKTLRISYEVLCPNEKEKFLDIACFFSGSLKYDEATLLRIWGKKDANLIELLNLKERCLIKINQENGVVTMHDQLRDMGRSVVKDHGKGLKDMTRIWEYNDVCKFLKTKESMSVQGLSFEEWGKALKPPTKGIIQKTLRKIQFIFFKQDNLILDSPQLRILDLHEVTSDFVVHMAIKDSSSIHWLCFNGSNITKAPKFVRHCTQLFVLHMRGCFFLKHLQSFVGELVNLLELDLYECWRLKHLSRSIGNLVNLSRLDLGYCDRLTCLPESIGNLTNLSRLNLQNCGGLKCLPESIGNLVNLSRLDLRYCYRLTCLPESIGNLTNLSRLDLGYCGRLKCLPESIGNLVNLSRLDLGYCYRLRCLPESIGNLVNLSRLHLGHCNGLTCLPESIGNLTNLLEFNLLDCYRLTCLPESIGNLVNLSRLDLGYCYGLTCLPESIGNLTNLSRLDLGYCGRLKCLPESIGNLVNLSRLDLGYCYGLTCLPESIGNLTNLSRLDLGYCGRLKCLPESIGNLVNLSRLDLRYCDRLTCLPESIGNLVNLSRLDLGYCYRLTCLPESIGNLVNLSRLDLGYCYRLRCLPESIGNLVNLSRLHLGHCNGLTCLPESIGNLTNLLEFNLLDCYRLTCLPESIGNLVNLG